MLKTKVLEKQACQRSLFRAKNVKLMYVRKKHTEWPITPYSGGYMRVVTKGGKAHSDIPILLQVFAGICNYFKTFLAILDHFQPASAISSHSNGSE
jgi:hypothetical protein